MPKLRLAAASIAALAGVAAALDTHAATASRDPAARGLDVFAHLPAEAAPGATLPVQLQALGYPTVSTLTPLAGAAVEAVWNPDKLGPGLAAAPAPVRGTTDASGRVHLDVPVPEGGPRDLELLIGLRSGDHRRTRAFPVSRARPYAVALHVSDRRVVPGGSAHAWVVVTRAATGEPAPGLPVSLALLEGGLPRQAIELSTDEAGTAAARVPIPWTDEPAWTWTLRAHAGKSAPEASEATATLTPREETPGAPRLTSRWDATGARAGEAIAFRLRVRDASGQPVASLPVEHWVGPRGTAPPKDDAEWRRVATRATTNLEGEIVGRAAAPETVVAGVGTSLTVVARASVEGHELRDEATVTVEAPTATAELLPEGGSIFPNITQRLLLRVLDGRGAPVRATFELAGDGLATTAATDAAGEAEVIWTPPEDVGALRNVGACAGGVAATVVVRWHGDVAALAPRRDPFELCLPVNRERAAMVVADRPFARAGEKARVRVLGGRRGPWSVVLRAWEGQGSASAWLDDGEAGGEVEIPRGASGVWTLSASSPALSRPARAAGGAILVAPAVLPSIRARVAGGRAAPGGAVDVDVELRDDRGRGLPGTIAAVLVDRNGGGSVDALASLDTRLRLCAALSVARERCDALAEGDPALDPLRRAELGARLPEPLGPANDPGGALREALRAAFGDVVRSLEGAVFEATSDPDRLRDVRRRAGAGFTWNPELMTLVTAAMDPRPTTPGGEPLALGDLLTIDPQVTFDHVARRVTRLKLFRVLSEVRAYRRERLLDPDEPALRDPNAIVRRLVQDGRLGADALLDPWGGTLAFAPSSGPPVPFLHVRGFELRAPGPDGKLGSADDVRDPFERVLRSGTPYADAVQEDRIVDAKIDLEVADATIDAWRTLFEELTGSALGGEGIGLGGIGTIGHGEGGGGRGYGVGLGRVGAAMSTGDAFWLPPTRTDPDGRARVRVRLGDLETTWRLALVGVPDRAPPATTTIDVPVTVPLAARVGAGAAWIEGDDVEVAIAIRSRADHPVRAELVIGAGGAAALVDPRDRARAVDVPAGGVATARVRVRGRTAGTGWLDVEASAPDLPRDTLRHEWEIRAAGELQTVVDAAWIDGERDLAIALAPGGFQRIGKPRLVLERGDARALEGALAAVEPDRLSSPDALADAVEVGARVERWAIAREGDTSRLAVRAADVARRALGRLAEHSASEVVVERRWPSFARARAFTRAGDPEVGAARECPPPGEPTLEAALDGLDAEPPPTGGSVRACWDAFVASASTRLHEGADAASLARAALALADRPHRAALATTLAARLREAARLEDSGDVVLGGRVPADRSSRAVVYAALLRTSALGKPAPAPRAALAARLAAQRDDRGGYGSPLATRSAVRALLATTLGDRPEKSVVTVTAEGLRKDLELTATGSIALPLDVPTDAVHVEVRGPGLSARLERLAVRRWAASRPASPGPLALDVAWPADARSGRTATLRVSLSQQLGRPVTIDTRVPLPPGVSLAEPVAGVRQVQGALFLRSELAQSGLPATLEIPLRFALAGKVTAPEARARLAHEEGAYAVAPARPVIIR